MKYSIKIYYKNIYLESPSYIRLHVNEVSVHYQK